MRVDNDEEPAVGRASREIIAELLGNLEYSTISAKVVSRVKAKYSKKYHLNGVIKNASVLAHASKSERELLAPFLRRKSTRTLSGVAVVAVMTKPLECPGKCVYCPGPGSQPDRPVAQSYTGREPAALRSLMYDYDPFLQVKSRIEDLEAIGHDADKIEVICMGGTLPAAPLEYQVEFVTGCIGGVLGHRVSALKEAKRQAETSQRRLVGLTFETRPDYCGQREINRMLDFGATRVEIGVQTVFDDVYEKNARGHTTRDSVSAIKLAKDAGLKVNLHVMPDLPGSSLERDREMFSTLFEDPSYRPDMLKIYPTLVLKGTRLHDMWKGGEYRPHGLEEIVKLIGDAKASLPPYVRVQRVQRDIPAPLIEAGVSKSNLRQLIHAYLERKGKKCGCIRCREQGFAASALEGDPDLSRATLRRITYEASGGTEIFASMESPSHNVLYGFARIRVPSPDSFRAEIPPGSSAILREIRVVGPLVRSRDKPKSRAVIQHRGLGSKLLREAESIVFDEIGLDKLVVISGLGVRTWFYARGYEADGPYVSKSKK
ncbi:MAG: tRNA uridine(34) 5-carboxymethylaminomethyl modification radical SAM/GNAT enzyme Elp3 [Promethearchaeota archaeon]